MTAEMDCWHSSECKSNEDQRDLIAVSHSRQCVLANEFACHQTVCDVVKLLKNDAAKQRQAEFPQNGTGLSDGQILIQIKHLSICLHLVHYTT